PVDCGNEATAMTDSIQRLAMREVHRQYARWLAVWSGTSTLRPGSCRPPFRRCPTCPASAGRQRAQFVVGDPTVAIRVGGFDALALVGENLGKRGAGIVVDVGGGQQRGVERGDQADEHRAAWPPHRFGTDVLRNGGLAGGRRARV